MRKANLSMPRLFVAFAAASSVATAAAGDQLLVDPSFENNPLIGWYDVLNNFEKYQGIWGVEKAYIVGATGQVIPPDGEKMLQMWPVGGVVTQAFQVTDVTAYSALIDSGSAVSLLSGLCNTHNVPQARTVVHNAYFSGPGVEFHIGDFWSLLDLDADVTTWETNLAQSSVPVGTRWVVSELAYDNELLQGHPGYFDAASLRIVPVGEMVLPDALNIFRGRLLSGGLAQLLQSDDERLAVAPGPVFTNSQSPIHIIIDGTAPSGNLSVLRFTLEGHTTSTNVEQRIELYNFLTSGYETVDLRPSTTSDSVAQVSITDNPQRFVEGRTRLMRTRMRYKANGAIFTYPWIASLDHTFWTVFP